jgi:hypothetical protein
VPVAVLAAVHIVALAAHNMDTVAVKVVVAVVAIVVVSAVMVIAIVPVMAAVAIVAVDIADMNLVAVTSFIPLTT